MALGLTFDFSRGREQRRQEALAQRRLEGQIAANELQQQQVRQTARQSTVQEIIPAIAFRVAELRAEGNSLAADDLLVTLRKMGQRAGFGQISDDELLSTGLKLRQQPTEFQRNINPLSGPEQLQAARVRAGITPRAQIPNFDQVNIYETDPQGNRVRLIGPGRFNNQTGVTTFQDGTPLQPGQQAFPVSVSAPSLRDVTGLTTGAATKAQQTLVDMRDDKARLENIRNQFDPSFLQWLPRLDLWLTSIRDKSGIFEPTQEDKQNRGRFVRFQADTMRRYNLLLQRLSGAAVTASEAERFKLNEPNMDDGPTDFLAKIDAAELDADAAIRRYETLVKRGIIGDGDKITQDVANQFPLDGFRNRFADMDQNELMNTEPPTNPDELDQYTDALQRALRQ